ncbi:MarR family winged helix-turn-helix transcriptional regulator [Marinitenerispora sediminis]|uniref:MarR family transcriptional regulator n=1 Tax=Marinitenerispora sediminis TaxID=1931232 RepID=A0A368T580_9ACTN|nr:MarR family transcriptional regulator [Marinitenerispora sediminis]RCV56691.1 MarR family transcriptional regulator [Marinitenerispora sediminis]RCV58456.1 MarR family transcriptional regulator [Marinitenerispora sediminis]RCV61683.1 MarR family transcriptional regulator [Marinitenerispora sediminis]
MCCMSAVNWLDADEQRTWRSYLVVNSMLEERLDRDLQQRNGLSLVEYGILVHLSEADGQRMRMRSLADTVIVSKSRLSHQIARLERDGYVRRETCAEDRRGAWAVLTPSGESKLREAAPWHVAAVRANLFGVLSDEQAKQLGEIMGVLEQRLRETSGA